MSQTDPGSNPRSISFSYTQKLQQVPEDKKCVHNPRKKEKWPKTFPGNWNCMNFTNVDKIMACPFIIT